MTEQNATVAKLGAAKLDEELGLPENLAAKLYGKLGMRVIAIVELVADEHGRNRNGRKSVVLRATHLEVASDPDVAEHLRELSRAIYTGRTPTQGRLDETATLDEVDPEADEVVRRGRALIQCPLCLNPHADDRISHGDPAEDGAQCRWRPCGHSIEYAGEQACDHEDHRLSPTNDPAVDGPTTAAIDWQAIEAGTPFTVTDEAGNVLGVGTVDGGGYADVDAALAEAEDLPDRVFVSFGEDSPRYLAVAGDMTPTEIAVDSATYATGRDAAAVALDEPEGVDVPGLDDDALGAELDQAARDADATELVEELNRPDAAAEAAVDADTCGECGLLEGFHLPDCSVRAALEEPATVDG